MGRALLLAGESCRAQVVGAVLRAGYACSEFSDPYATMVELCRRPLAYRVLVVSLQSLFREELAIIAAVKARFAHIEVWLTHIEGRQAAFAEAMRHGADFLLSDEGVHPLSAAPPQNANGNDNGHESVVRGATAAREREEHDDSELSANEPVLTADELRALLQDQPTLKEHEAT